MWSNRAMWYLLAPDRLVSEVDDVTSFDVAAFDHGYPLQVFVFHFLNLHMSQLLLCYRGLGAYTL